MKKVLTRCTFILAMFLVLNFAVVYGSTITSGIYTYYELDDGTIRLDGCDTSVQNIVIPATIDGKKVSQIGSVFNRNSTVKTITIPEGVERINAYAFNRCPNLTYVSLPSTLKYIERLFCYNCPNISYTIPENLALMSDGTYVEVETVTICGDYNYDLANKVFTLVNEERAALGLTAYTYSQELTEAAMLRAAETSIYWEHERPDSTQITNVSSLIDAENIGVGTSSATQIMNGWMNSAGHKRQIVSTSHVSIGVGCYQVDGITYWVQEFSDDASTNTTQITGKTEDVVNKVQVKADDGRLVLYLYGLDSEISLSVGETAQATKAKIVNKGYTSAKTQISLSDIDWSSSDESVFTVDKNGLITAVGGGSATLTAELDETTITCNITVSKNTDTYDDADYLQGDLNKDGVVNANDAAYALDLFKYESATEEDIKIGDLNDDGVINANDAAAILDLFKYAN